MNPIARMFSDRYRVCVFAAGLFWAALIQQGLPYWDADYLNVFKPVLARPLSSHLVDLLSPGSTDPGNWGFMDRTAEFAMYSFSHLIAGYNPWPYLILRILAMAGLGLVAYRWSLRLLSGGQGDRPAAAAAAVFLIVAPGPAAAMVWLPDFAPITECILAFLAYRFWCEVEQTPPDWTSLSPGRPEHRRWIVRWALLSFATYLAYKTKADVKLLPVILALYLALTRRSQWKLFCWPIAAMFALAVPWGSQLRLPAFLPGSQGSATPWMWQPASLDRLSEYLWSNQPYSFVDSFKSSPLSLAGLLGPFLLTGLIVFAYWRFGETMVQSPPQAAAPTHTPEKRARLFVFLWMLVMIAGMSALPGIPDFFRIRYSIMPFPPLCILLGWMLGLFLEACRGESGRRLSRRAAVGFAALFALQLAINAGRSLHYRRELGGLEIAIDRLYTHIEKSFPADSVAATPDFLSYSWKPDHITPLHAINRLNSLADLEGRFQPGRTLVLSWNAVLDERVDTIGFFSGCPGGILFDHLFPCAPGVGAVLMRYIGRDLRYEAATTAKDSSNLPLARIAYEQFLADHPGNLAAHFWLGYTTSYLKDWQAADLHNRLVENYLPDTQGVIYNRALSLAALKQYDPAIRRLERVSKMAPNTYGVLWNLYWAYRNSGRKREAADTLATMRSLFPDDPETRKLSADM